MRFERDWQSEADESHYDDVSYSRLPHLPEHLFTGDFGWLTPQAAGPDAHYMEPDPLPEWQIQALERQLAGSGHTLPASFVTFMSSADLQHRVPSGSHCGWGTPEQAALSPIEEDGFVLRFMHGQQGAWYHHLYFAHDGSCYVIGTDDGFYGEDDEDGDEVVTPREFMQSARWEAPTFEHFVYRTWVEEIIWDGLIYQKRPPESLPRAAQDYLRQLRDPGSQPLDVWPTPLNWTGDLADLDLVLPRRPEVDPNQLTLW